MENKPYLLFAGHQYYPHGGWDDLVGRFATIAAAKRAYSKGDYGSFGWGHLIRNDEKVAFFSSVEQKWVEL